MIVPAPAGGQTDVLARLLAQKIQAAVGQNVIIDNRPGAGGALGARALAAAEPDGYTLFYGNTSTLAVIPAVSKNPGYDPAKNFAPIASVSDSYMILVVHPSFPAKTVQEFVAYAKANPGKLNFGHAGAGNVTHLTGEMFRSLARIEFLGVPYRGGAEFDHRPAGTAKRFPVREPGGAVAADSRRQAACARRDQREPQVRASRHADHGGGRRAWFHRHLADRHRGAGRYARAIVGKLNGVINETLAAADMRELLTKFGSQARIGSPQDFASFLAGETRKWADIAKAANVSVE